MMLWTKDTFPNSACISTIASNDAYGSFGIAAVQSNAKILGIPLISSGLFQV